MEIDVLILCPFVAAWISPADLTALRDYLGPYGPALLTSIISLGSAAIFFFIIPRRAKRLETTFDLIKEYNSDSMEESRREAFEFLNNPQTGKENIGKFCDWVSQSHFYGGSDIPKLQKVLRVLNFFAVLEVGLARHQVHKGVLRASLGWSYDSWRRTVLEPVRLQLPPIDPRNHQPAWRKSLKKLDKLVTDYSR